MPLDVAGTQSTFPPTACGGNMDCRELVAGTTLFLPIAVAGGLFSTGDGHAVQGDGEIAGPALIQEHGTTTVLFEHDACTVAPSGELLITVEAA